MLWEQPELAGAGKCCVAELGAADVEVPVSPDVHSERPSGTTVPQHQPHQLQADVQGHLRSAVEASKIARKERAETEAVQRRLDTEMDERRSFRFADRQTVDTGIRGERLNRLKVGRLDLADGRQRRTY